uniref:Uncharacterized protein n=1 Tax=Lygus hesperus TaxID=30085 RepID=A0A0K8S9B7_LYGHE
MLMTSNGPLSRSQPSQGQSPPQPLRHQDHRGERGVVHRLRNHGGASHSQNSIKIGQSPNIFPYSQGTKRKKNPLPAPSGQRWWKRFTPTPANNEVELKAKYPIGTSYPPPSTTKTSDT